MLPLPTAAMPAREPCITFVALEISAYSREKNRCDSTFIDFVGIDLSVVVSRLATEAIDRRIVVIVIVARCTTTT